MKCPKCHFDNPSDSGFCNKCGTQIGGHEPKSPEFGIVSPGFKTETLQTPIKELTTGSTFAGRYQIIEELGKGGMGKVYKVFDQEVQAKMALKLIKPEVSADKNTIDRFRNELKIARDISHKNICRMYDLGREAGNYFITMEYVSGEDLKSFIRRSRQLVVGTAIFIAKQVCDGLAEAHRLGVVHRDLKPGNIMIDKEGNAKIMDFGIARSISVKGITGAGVMIGTPEYMSPEQVEGKEVDQRSDIYSLGIILYEMLTGQVPFEGDTPFTIGVKQKSEIPKNPRELNVQIPQDLSRLVLKCLEKDKERRYQNADELRADLEKIEKGIPTTERPIPKRKTVTAKPITVTLSRKKLLIPTLIIALVAIAAIIWFAFLKKKVPLLPEQKRSIAIISFENQTGDKAYDYLSKVIPNLLITDLEQSGFFNVTTWERIYDLLKQVGKPDTEFIGRDLGFELCQKDGVEVIVLGSVTKAGNTFVADAKVMDVGTKKLLGTANSRGDSPDSILKNQVDDLSRQIAKGVGLSEQKFAAATKRIGELTTDSLEAYNYYIKGQQEGEKLHQGQSHQYYEKAVELDPNFAMALRNLGGESLKRAKALSKNVTEKERLYIEASYASGIEKNEPKAISIRRQIVEKYPKEKGAYYTLGNGAENPQEAIEFYRKALELDPNYAPALNHISYSFLQLRQYDQAIDAFKKYVSVRPGDANPLDSLAEAYFQMGRLDDAVETYNKALQVDPGYYNSMLVIGYICALRGDYSQAFKWVDRAITVTIGTDKPCPYFWKAFYLAWLGSYEKSFASIQTAEDLSVALKVERGEVLANLLRAWIYYDRGDLESSRKFNELLTSHDSLDRVGYDFLGGLIDLEEKKVESARSRLPEMNSLAPGLPKTWTQRDMADFETEWLRNMIMLREKSFDQTVASFARNSDPKFVPYWNVWNLMADQRFRYNTPFQRDVLARAFAEREEIDKAITEYEKLITLDLTKPARLLVHPLYHYRLGKLYEQKGLKDKAKVQYQRFLDLWKDADPGRSEVEDAKKHLDKLKS